MTEVKLARKTILIAGLLAALLAGATPTLAGFQFKTPAPAISAPPSSLPPPFPYVPPAASPVTPPAQSMQSGSIIWGENVPQMPAQSVPGIEAIPLSPAERGSLPLSSSDIVSGFGSDLPLLVALHQVVPQQYKVSLSPGVDSKRHVSWRGDRPWKDVLTDMLASVRLAFEIEGNRVIVKHIGNGFPIARVVSPSSKADMIPEDMLSGNSSKKYMLPPIAMAPHPLSSVQEAEVAPLPPPQMAPVPEEAVPVHVPPVAHAPLLPMPTTTAAPVRVAVAPVPASAVERSWHAIRGQTLKEVLRSWSEAAHVRLYWTTDYDYKLNTDISYTGNYEEAVGRLLDRFANARPQPYGQLHKNAETAPVLIVNTYGTYN